MSADSDDLALERVLRAMDAAMQSDTQSLVGVGGRYGAGKDALADFLVEDHGFQKLGMSDALAEALKILDPEVHLPEAWSQKDWITWCEDNGWDWTWTTARYATLLECVGYVQAKRIPEVRRLLQRLGTDVGRNLLGENVWVDAIAERIAAIRHRGVPVVVTGIRFPNEAAMVRRLGGTLVWVERNMTAGQHSLTAGHVSESSVAAKDFDYRVQNTGTLDDLRDHARALVAHLEE